MKVTVVVPTIRESCITAFLEVWEELVDRAHVLVVEDNPTRTFDLSRWPSVTHLCWEDIDGELGERSWVVPRRTDCVRSYGYYRAWQDRPDMIVTLDDDCYPIERGGEGFLDRHWQRLEEGGSHAAWTPSGIGPITRGHPYYETERRWPCAINHGLWQRVPDYDAPTQMVLQRTGGDFEFENRTIPTGRYFPMCGMNVAFRPIVVPAFYFLLMGRSHPVDRFGDIWAGVFVKRICDHLGWAVNSGDPAIDHQRASNVWANLRKEAPGLELNETLWRSVDETRLTETTFAGCYRQIAEALPTDGPLGDYLGTLGRAMVTWTELFDGAAIGEEDLAARKLVEVR
jgi:hypothetical protein